MALSSWKILFWISISAKLSPHFNFCLRQIYIPTGVHAQKKSHPILNNVLLLYCDLFILFFYEKDGIDSYNCSEIVGCISCWNILRRNTRIPFPSLVLWQDKSQPNNLQLLPSRYDFSFVIVNHLSLQCYFLLNG